MESVVQRLLNALDGQHPPLSNFIDGRFVEAKKHMDSVDPSTGQPWIQIPDSDREDVEMAVEAAAWSSTTVNYRSNLLLKVAEIVEKNIESLAVLESRDQGKPVKLARLMDIPRCAHNFKFFATTILHHTSPSTLLDDPKALNYVKHDSVGVAGLISPWNLPLYLLSFKLAPALATGNTVVCKPSEMTSVTAWCLMHAFLEAGFPPGVVNMVIGTGPSVGEPLITHPQVPLVSFTGSTVIGKRIAELGAKYNKKISLEMGGKNACIVFPSTDLDKHIPTIARSCFINQGEICLCTSRLYVHNDIKEDFVKRLQEAAKAFTVGDPRAESSVLGALNSQTHFEKVKGYVDLAKTEGNVLCGGVVNLEGQCSNGYYISPTIVTDIADESRCMTEEIFGPVVCVTSFKSSEDVIRRANATNYGLSATVFGEKSDELINTANALRVGTVWVNCWLARDLNMPFGGTRESGQGREGAADSFHFFTEPKTVCIKL